MWILPVVALLLVGTGCDELIDDLTTPNVTQVAINEGAQLRLNWAPVKGAQGYKIDVDGTEYTTTETTYDVDGPAKMITVLAYSGASESNKWSLNLTPVMTQTLEVWGISEPSPDNPSSFGFNTDGTITTYSINAANYPAMDYYMEDTQLPGMNIVNPGDRGWNAKGNAAKAAGTTDFDAATIADAPGGYTTQQQLAVGGVYFLWLDRTNNNWDVTDNFAKAKVVSIQGTKVTMQVAYQKVGGLRWLKTN